MLGNLFSGGAAELVKGVGGVIDSLHTSKEEKLEAERKIKEIIANHEAEMEKNINMWSLFKDKNEINEKNVVGFASFVVMVLFAIADLTTSFIFVGEESKLIINEVIYNSFVWVTLGFFGISSFEKVKTK